MQFQCSQKVAEAIIITLQLIQGVLILKNAESLRVNTKQTFLIKDKVVNSKNYKKNED